MRTRKGGFHHENGWSRNVLVHQIETDAYARHALAAKTTTYLTTLPAPIGEFEVFSTRLF